MSVLFLLLSAFALMGAWGMIAFRQPIHSALSLIVTLLALSGLFALLHAGFLFMVTIIIYAGAIITLFIFIIMFLNIKESDLPKEPYKNLTLFIGFLVLVPLNIVVLKAFLNLPLSQSVLPSDFGDAASVGMVLFKGWILPFELISLLLIVALLGAVVLAKKKEDA